MFYDWHPDGRGDHFGVYKNIANPKIHDNVRKLSMSVVLNDDFEGGKLGFKTGKGVVEYEPTVGRIVIFPAYLTHRGNAFRNKVRYTVALKF